MTVADPQIHRFTRAEYDQMAAMGLFDEKRVELIGGAILDMSPQNNPHAVAITLLNRFLTKHLSEDFMVRCQLPLAVTDMDEPEPDFAVVPGKVEDLKEHPSTAPFIVEVAYDSFRRDRKKAGLYAQAGVAEYWIINLKSREIIQHTDPRQGAPGESVGKYATVRTLSAGETIACSVLPLPPRVVENLLPPF